MVNAMPIEAVAELAAVSTLSAGVKQGLRSPMSGEETDCSHENPVNDGDDDTLIVDLD